MPPKSALPSRAIALPTYALATLLGSAAATGRADVFAPPGTPYQLFTIPDIGLIAGGVTLWAMPTLVLHDQIPPPPCIPACNPADVNGFDRWSIQYHYDSLRSVSDAIYGIYAAGFLALELTDLARHNAKAFVVDLAIATEMLAWQGVLDELFRRAVHRPRPYLYVEGVFPDRRTEGEAGFSFYSGHTAAAFAASLFIGYTWSKRHPRSPWRYPLWAGLYALAAAEGTLRIFSGDHFTTDVITGALVGTAFGLIVPFVHLRSEPLIPGVSSLSLSAASRDGTTMFSVSGRF